MVMETLIVFKGGGLKSRVVIPKKHIKTWGIHEMKFMHVSTCPNFAQCLYGPAGRVYVEGKPERPLATRTDVVQQLTELRNEKIAAELAKVMQTEQPRHVLTLFAKSGKRRVKRHHRAAIPATTIIDAPTIGDVAGIPMTVMMSTKNASLYMECTENNVKYVRDACLSQLESGAIKRPRVSPKKRAEPDDAPNINDADTANNSVIDDTQPSEPTIASHDNPSASSSDHASTPVKCGTRSTTVSDYFKRV